MGSIEPSSTLRGDPFDAPAAVSLAEAAKASAPGGHEGHSTKGITPGEDHENPPTPMPATRDGSTRGGSTTDHGGHGSNPASPPPSEAAVMYVCPMHPEVTSTRPGTCPKCTMALVKKK